MKEMKIKRREKKDIHEISDEITMNNSFAQIILSSHTFEAVTSILYASL